MKRYTFGFFVALTALPALAAGGVSRLLPDGTSTNSNGNARTPVAQVPSDASAARGTSGDGQTVSRVAITRNIPTRVVSGARKTVDTVAQTDRGVAVARSQTNDSARSNLTNAVKTVGRNSDSGHGGRDGADRERGRSGGLFRREAGRDPAA